MPDTKNKKQSKISYILPVLFVLMIASILVFIKVLPEMPAIVDTTEEFREDKDAIIEAPPLPEPDTSSVRITDPNIFEPEPPDTRGENVTDEDLEPTSRSKTMAGIIDALIFIGIAVVGGFGIYLLFKYKKKMTLKAMFSSLLMIVTIATCIFFGFMVYRVIEFGTDPGLGDYQVFAIMLLLSVPIGAVVTHSMFSKNKTMKTRNLGLLLTGALMGSFMAALLPLYGVIPLAVAISLFDIYSVRRGPIKKIMTLADEEYNEKIAKKKEERKKMKVEREKEVIDVPSVASGGSQDPVDGKISVPGVTIKKIAKPADDFDDDDLILMYETPTWSIGVGDFVIYSMFAAFVLTHTMQFLPYYGFYTPTLGFVIPWLVFLVTTVGLLGGFFFTLRLLSKRSLMPGLPLAILLGLSAFLIQLAIMEIINFLAYGKFAPIV